MSDDQKIYSLEDLDFKIIFSGRRTIGISVLPDATVVVRVPYLTTQKKIFRVVNEKYAWIIKHRDNYRNLSNNSLQRVYADGEKHLFKGNESILRIERSAKPYIRFYDSTMQMGLDKTDNALAVKTLLYYGYKNEAMIHFPFLLNKLLKEHELQGFKPSGLVIRSMKRRWGSCSGKGVVTLSTELIKLPDLFIEYVILHELCHLKQHNHGPLFYKLLSEVFPEWKSVRKELRKYIQ